MKKLVFTLALAALPSMAFAAGIDLSWDDCVVGGAPQSNRTFNCAANANYNLHFQFKLPQGLPGFVSMTAYADYQNTTGTPLTSFWRYEPGSCQQTPTQKGASIFDDLGTSSLFSPACLPSADGGAYEDAWGGNGAGGTETINAFGIDFRRPGNGYFVLLDYRADGLAFPLAGSPANYWAFRVNFKTHNRGACAGCTDQGILLFQRLSLESNDGTPVMNLDNADKGVVCTTINGGPAGLCPTVPARSTTWGQLKSLYR